jgi:hypothetical protein
MKTALQFASCLVVSLMALGARAQFTLIDFENIPPTYTPVDTFGSLLPGVTLISGNRWIADEVCNICFQNIYGRAITAFPDGSAPLTIHFASPAQNVRMDFGSSVLGNTLTIGVSGYRNNQLVFTDSFTTAPVAGGADEVRAQTSGLVDSLIVERTGGSVNLIMDNLGFTTVPEPGVLSLVVTGGFLLCRKARPANVPFKRRLCLFHSSS